MANRVTWGGFVSLEVPPGWEYEEDQNGQLVTLYDPVNGVGAFQISFGIHHRPVEDPRTLVEQRIKAFAEDYVPQGAPATVTEANGIWQAHTEFSVDDQNYWQAWYWSSPAKRVFMTYNCETADRGIESVLYQQIVASVRWL